MPLPVIVENHALKLTLSVIIPMVRHREQAIACIKSWAHEQSFAREKFEVIVVANGSETQIESEIRELLAPHDSLIRGPSTNQMHLYDIGARHARGQLLFFTELHCVGESACLAEIVRFLGTHHDLKGTCCRSHDPSANRFAQMEERCYQEGAPVWLQADHWRKIMMRGFAIYRQLYLAEGGFEYEYGLFSESLFAARLHSRGLRLGYAANAVVRHYNSRSLAELSDSVKEFVDGECRYQSKPSSGKYESYLGHFPEWSARESLRARVARSLCRAIIRSLPIDPRTGNILSSLWTHRHSLLRFGLTALFGPRWHLCRLLLALRLTQARIWFWRGNFNRCYLAYRDYWETRLPQYLRLQFVAEHLSASIPTWPDTYCYDLARLEDERLVGFHAVEVSPGRAFRWTAPVALIHVSLPQGSYEVTMETFDARSEGFPLRLQLFFDNHRISGFCLDSDFSEISFQLEAPMFVAGAEAHQLILVCNPFRPRKFGSADPRELGLPLRAIRFSANPNQ